MATTFRVTDLQHFLNGKGSLAPEAHKLGAWLASLVECTTAMGMPMLREWALVPVGCSECRSTTVRHAIVARSADDAIEWACPACQAAGSITNWEETSFDFRTVEDPEADECSVLVHARLDEIDAIRNIVRGRDMRLVLALAVAFRDHVVVTATVREIGELLEAIRGGMTQLRGPARLACERFIGRIDSALLAVEHSAPSLPVRDH